MKLILHRFPNLLSQHDVEWMGIWLLWDSGGFAGGITQTQELGNASVFHHTDIV